jgi:hypothetical protein
MQDVVFKEDAAQAKAGFIAENMAFFRRLSMNFIKTADPGRGFADALRAKIFERNFRKDICRLSYQIFFIRRPWGQDLSLHHYKNIQLV